MIVVERTATKLCESATKLHETWVRKLTSNLGIEIRKRLVTFEEEPYQFSRFNPRIRYKRIKSCEARPTLGANERKTLESLKREYDQEIAALINGSESKKLVRDQRKAYMERMLVETPGIADHDSERVIIYTSDLTGPCFLRTELDLAGIRKKIGTSAMMIPAEKQIHDVVFADHEPLQSNLPNSLEFDKKTTDALLDEEAREGARLYMTRNPSPAVIPEEMITYLARYLMSQQQAQTVQHPASIYTERGSVDRTRDKTEETAVGSIDDALLREVTRPNLEQYLPLEEQRRKRSEH